MRARQTSPGFTEDGEANPFLGVRGLRLCLMRPDVFTVQLRALARAAMHQTLKVMFPRVTTPEELELARKLFVDVVGRLQAEGTGGYALVFLCSPLQEHDDFPHCLLLGPGSGDAAGWYRTDAVNLT